MDKYGVRRKKPRSTFGAQTGAEVEDQTERSLGDRPQPHLLGAGERVGWGRSTEVPGLKSARGETFLDLNPNSRVNCRQKVQCVGASFLPVHRSAEARPP